MRQWMVNPRLLCNVHLLGEHHEHHMFVGSLNRGTSMSGYIENNLLEATSIVARHDVLAKEMERRGIKHRTPIVQSEIALESLSEEEYIYVIDRKAALRDLLTRCSACVYKAKELQDKGVNLLDAFCVEITNEQATLQERSRSKSGSAFEEVTE